MPRDCFFYQSPRLVEEQPLSFANWTLIEKMNDAQNEMEQLNTSENISASRLYLSACIQD